MALSRRVDDAVSNASAADGLRVSIWLSGTGLAAVLTRVGPFRPHRGYPPLGFPTRFLIRTPLLQSQACRLHKSRCQNRGGREILVGWDIGRKGPQIGFAVLDREVREVSQCRISALASQCG